MNPDHALADAPEASAAPVSKGVGHSVMEHSTATEQRPATSLSPRSAPVTPSSHEIDSLRHHLPSTQTSSTQPNHQMHFTPIRKDTGSSISTQATIGSADINPASYTLETSPNLHQSIFSVKDGSDISSSRRASRRRTGPLSQQSRERAALIRKLGACGDCRRRRVACHPSHHGMTWEDVVSKFHRSHSPSMQDLAPILAPGRPLSPTTSHGEGQSLFSHDHEMDVDASSVVSPNTYGRPALGETRLRTPLPTGPRLEKSLSLPGIESLRNDLQITSSKFFSSLNRGRYTDVHVLLVLWKGDDEAAVVENVARELADVLERHYRFSFQIQIIPSSEIGTSKAAWRWLSLTIDSFLDHHDRRDVLKIVYYGGHTFLDGNREMNLASSRDLKRATLVRWNAIQQRLEDSTSDTLILMDAAFYPGPRIVRRQGVLEIVAASLSEDHYNTLGRFTFTKLLAEQLRIRAARGYPLSVAELHSVLLSNYPRVVHEKHPEIEVLTSYPAPLHIMTSSNARLPSIFLSPIQLSSPPRSSFAYENNAQLQLSLKLSDESIDAQSWNEWLRLMPEGVKEVKIEGPFRATFT